jgi:hydrogenase nickel incorporation protein HypA/HybF
MHELSIAMSIAEIVEEEARKAGASRIEIVTIEIGTLSGVMIDALQFAMEEVMLTTSFSGAKINYDIVTAVASCEECCNEFVAEDLFKVCPVCNSSKTYYIRGKELKIKSIEVERDN